MSEDKPVYLEEWAKDTSGHGVRLVDGLKSLDELYEAKIHIDQFRDRVAMLDLPELSYLEERIATTLIRCSSIAQTKSRDPSDRYQANAAALHFAAKRKCVKARIHLLSHHQDAGAKAERKEALRVALDELDDAIGVGDVLRGLQSVSVALRAAWKLDEE